MPSQSFSYKGLKVSWFRIPIGHVFARKLFFKRAAMPKIFIDCLFARLQTLYFMQIKYIYVNLLQNKYCLRLLRAFLCSSKNWLIKSHLKNSILIDALVEFQNFVCSALVSHLTHCQHHDCTDHSESFLTLKFPFLHLLTLPHDWYCHVLSIGCKQMEMRKVFPTIFHETAQHWSEKNIPHGSLFSTNLRFNGKRENSKRSCLFRNTPEQCFF